MHHFGRVRVAVVDGFGDARGVYKVGSFEHQTQLWPAERDRRGGRHYGAAGHAARIGVVDSDRRAETGGEHGAGRDGPLGDGVHLTGSGVLEGGLEQDAAGE